MDLASRQYAAHEGVVVLLRREVLQLVNHKVELGGRPRSEFLLLATCFGDLALLVVLIYPDFHPICEGVDEL